jgi:hypothetical protein
MEKSYSLFFTSMQPSVYVNPTYFLEKNINIENILNTNKISENVPYEYKCRDDTNNIIFRINSSPKNSFRKNKTMNSNSYRKVKIFVEENKTIYINGIDFYISNNIKKDIWWTVDELKQFRNMFFEEVNRRKFFQPWMTHKECVKELCK